MSCRLPSRRTVRPVAAVLGVVLLAGLAAFGGAAYASHQFSDVPDAHPFHDEITAMGDAGITTGFGDGTFRPGQPLTRQAMSAFLARGLGHVALAAESATVSPGTVDDTTAVLAEVEVTSPAPEGSGWALVQVDLNAETADPASCACRVFLQLSDGSTTTELRGLTIGGEADADGTAAANMTQTHLFELPGGATRTYRAVVTLLDTDVSGVDVHTTLTAEFVPFGGVIGEAADSW